MNLVFVPFFAVCLLISNEAAADPENIWDQVIRQEQVFSSVFYKGRSLAMWRQEANGFTRYYVTPLCILDLSSPSCSKETFTQSRKIAFHFNVKLWDHDIATVVQKHLRQKHIEAELGDIFILPMQSVRYGQRAKIIKVKPDYAWRPYGDVPFEMTFKMYALGPQICKNLIDSIKKEPKRFIEEFQPYFEYTLVASTTTSRHIKITGNFLQKSSFYSNLTNHNPDKNGIVYMTSEDANKLAHDVFNSATFDEEVSKGYQASDQEGSIIKELLKNFETDKIQSIKLSKENWDSVFWDNIFTRPDVQTSFLNEVATVDGHKKRVKLDDKKAKAFVKKLANKNSKGHDDSANVGAMFAGVGVEVGRGHGETNSDTNVNEDSGKTVDSFSLDKFKEKLRKSKANVQWNGKKFVQKNIELFRVNTKNLKSVTETAFNRVIVKKEKSTHQIEIKLDTQEDKDWVGVYDKIPTLPTTTTTTTTTPKPTTTKKHTTKKTTTTKKPSTTTAKPLCPDPIDKDVYRTLILKGTEPCQYMHNVWHPTPSPTQPPPPPPPPQQSHSTNIGDVANTALNIAGKIFCPFCG